MAVVSWQLASASLVDWTTVTIGAGSLVLLLSFRLNSVWLVLGGGLLGYVKHYSGFFLEGSKTVNNLHCY